MPNSSDLGPGREITGATVRPARADELPTVLAILTAAARWWARTGYPSPWPDPFPAERVRPSLASGDLFVADLRGRIVGTFTRLWEDPEFWGSRPPNAGYLHRIAIDRSVSGRGFGRWMIERAVDEIRSSGRPFARLDTARSNTKLRSYYRSLGFAEVGEGRVHEVDVVLFERRLGVGEAAPSRRAPGDGADGALPTGEKR